MKELRRKFTKPRKDKESFITSVKKEALHVKIDQKNVAK